MGSPQLLGTALTELKRTDLAVQQERVVLMAVLLPGREVNVRRPLDELASLAETAGAEVVDGLVQKLTKVNASTYMGRGKAEELRDRAEANEAGTIIFDNDLSPRQIRELEKITGCKIIDRSELILDIFAARARTREARLQVELAQLEYTAPRLRGMWTHLERLAGAGGGGAIGAVGGIGTRGPGERQIEIDRRLVRDRVSRLRDELAKIDLRKQREVQSRATEFTVSLVGYTNSGKSTVMNALTGAGQPVEDKLFATLDTKTARWILGDGQTALLSDTVGFVRDLPHRLVASFRATLEEVIHADLLLHVVDVSSEEAPLQIRAVDEVLADLDCADRPTLVLLNKMDIVEDPSIVQIVESRVRRSLRISGHTGVGLDAVVEAVSEMIGGSVVQATVRFPAREGKLSAWIDRMATVLDRRYDNESVEMDLRISRTHLDQLCGRHPTLTVIDRNG